ncbi:MAG TPA: protein kinase, partial [Sandaracinaceae bacterium]
TPEYMSPEQAISARKVRAPGDVWSVGVMLYELLSGQHPFSGETPNAIMANAIKEPLPPLASTAPHVPASLARLIERCLEKKPEDRPADAGQMLAELRAVLATVELDDTVPSAPVPPQKWAEEEEDEGPDSSPELLSPARSVEIPTEREPATGDTAAPRVRRGARRIVLTLASVGVVALGASLGVWAMMAAEEREIVARELAPAGEPERGEPRPPERPEPALVLDAPEGAPAEAADPPAEAPATEPRPPEPPARTPRRPASRAAKADGPSALDEARDCLNRGDRQCARRILEQRARTAAEHALLIDTYRELGMMGPMLDRMERFVRRWPNAPQTREYRELLHRYGR